MPDTPVFSTAAVVAPDLRAAETGQRILASGGNAVEAVIAMAATAAVVLPHLNGLGGDGFFLVREPRGRVHGIDASGPAGALATIERYRAKDYAAVPALGPDAALTVAGVVAGWALGLELSKAVGGRLPLPMLLTDAISLAREGYAVTQTEAGSPIDHSLLANGHFASAYLVEGEPASAGHMRTSPRLADTLERLSHAGLMDFYRGDVGREIASDLDRIGSPVVRRDLEAYQARVVEPLSVRLSGASLYNLPASSQGVASLLVAGVADRLHRRGSEDAAFHHGIIEAAKRAMALRDRLVADPHEVDMDLADLLEDAFLQREAEQVDRSRAGSAGLPRSEGDAAWFGCIDVNGLAVSYVQSIHNPFGSGCVLPETGILWHNRGVDFSLDPASRRALAPGRKPFHTLNAALAVFADNRVLAYGATNLQAQAQVLAQYVDLGRTLAQAVDAPRWAMAGAGLEDAVLAVEEGFDGTLARNLARLGHQVADIGGLEAFGRAGMIVKHPRNGRVEAFADSRGDGSVLGL